MEVSVSDCKEVIWGVLDDHGVEEPKENNEIGLNGFILICLVQTGGEGVGVDLLSLFIIVNEDM